MHDGGRSLATMDAIRAFFVEHGVAGNDFDKHARSFSVQSGLQRSLVMQAGYGLRGVPVLIVNGRFLISRSTAGSYPKVLEGRGCAHRPRARRGARGLNHRGAGPRGPAPPAGPARPGPAQPAMRITVRPVTDPSM